MIPLKTSFTLLCLAATGSVVFHSVYTMFYRNEYPSPKFVTTSQQPKRGYLTSLKYYEQQTQATKNILQFQCLADSYGMKIVEPFVHQSFFSLPFSEMISSEKIPMKFGDIINLQSWNEQTRIKYEYVNMATWDEFLQDAPKDVVVVCVRYRDPHHLPVPNPGQGYTTGCKEGCYNAFSSSLTYLAKYQFRLVKKVCANFVDSATSVEESNFKKHILGRLKQDGVTVLLNEFRGFFGLYRMPVVSTCGVRHRRMNISIFPSHRLVNEVHRYVHMNFMDRPFFSVLVRMERIVQHTRVNKTRCIQEVLVTLQRLRYERKLRDNVLGMDVGRFGSRGSSVHNINHLGKEFFRIVNLTNQSFEDWENSFSNFLGSINPAYIANFQRTLATRSECLILVGDSYN